MSGEFDAGGYLKAAGYELTGPGEQEGIVRVVGPDGNTGSVDLNALLAQNGLQGARIQYNTPESALNSSPVGFLDRVKLGLGNAQGQLQYLKHNYQDAKLTGDGDLVVKDKGIWHRVDARGLGDGSGWDMAKELAGDVADWTKDVGIGLGNAGGAIAGVPAGPAGAVVGAGIGAGAASAAMAALGRVVGTYEATPDQVIKDIGMDTLLGMAGEGVALGAKHAIVPALKASLSKLSTLAGPVKSQVAGLLRAATGVSEGSTMRALNQAEAVGAKVEGFLQAAAAPEAVPTGSALDNLVATGVAPGSDEAINAVARRSSIGDARQLMADAQRRLSAKWRAGREEIVNTIGDDQVLDVKAPISNALGQMQQRLGDLMRPVYNQSGELVQFELAQPKRIAEALAAQGVDELSAREIRANAQAFINASTAMVRDPQQAVGKEGMRRVFDTMQAFDDFYYNLIDGRPQLEGLFTGISSQLKDGLSLTGGEQAQAGMRRLAQWYGTQKPAVTMAQKALQQGDRGVEGVLNQLLTPSERNLTAHTQMRDLAGLFSDSSVGQAAYDSLLNTVAAAEFARSVPKGALGASLPRIGAGAAGFFLSGGNPLVGAAAYGAASPRSALKGITTVAKGLSTMGSTFRKMDARTRNSILANPQALGGMITTALGGAVDPNDAQAIQNSIQAGQY